MESFETWYERFKGERVIVAYDNSLAKVVVRDKNMPWKIITTYVA